MMRGKHSSSGLNRLALAAALLGICVLTSEPAVAGTASASNTWRDYFVACDGNVCLPGYFKYSTLVEVNYYSAGRDEPRHVVYWQRFNATDTRDSISSICRPHALTKGATYYKTSTGNVSIGGWWVTASSATRDKTIKNYFSDKDYTLTCVGGTCTGKFTGIVTPSNSYCVPTSKSYTTNITF